MSEANKAVIRRWFEEVWTNGRDSAIEEMLDANGKAYGLGPAPVIGPAGFRPFFQQFRGAFPDIKVTVDDIVAEGDTVAYRFTARAKHTGETLGIKSTQRPVQFTAMGFVKMKNGKITEAWNEFDQLGMMRQIGAIPS